MHQQVIWCLLKAIELACHELSIAFLFPWLQKEDAQMQGEEKQATKQQFGKE